MDWKNDALNRKADAEYIAGFLRTRLEELSATNNPRGYVLNIDSSWGTGKTFFLTEFANDLRKQGHLVAVVNAWETDHADDPMLAVMASIEVAAELILAPNNGSPTSAGLSNALSNLKGRAGEVVIAAGKGLLWSLGKRWLGEGMDEISAVVVGDAEKAEGSGDAAIGEVEKLYRKVVETRAKGLVDEYKLGAEAIQHFRNQLAQVAVELAAQGVPMPMFIFIDELDRCRPTYAIQMLERIKHLFNVDQTAFVVATDTRQLSHAVSAIYGSTFNASAYLRRFFDLTYKFDTPDISNYVDDLLARYPLNPSIFLLPHQVKLEDYIRTTFQQYDLSLRDIRQAYELLRTVASAWSSDKGIIMAALLPMIIARQQNFDLSDSKLPELMRNMTRSSTVGQPWRLTLRSQYGTQEDETGPHALFAKLWAHRRKTVSQISTELNNNLPGWERWVVETLVGSMNGSKGSFQNYHKHIEMAGRFSEL